MSEENKRRKFIKNALLTVVGGTILGKSASVLATDREEKPKLILRVKPLGFQWDTQDPFLFCVHHEDAYPKGNTALGPDKSLLSGRNMGNDFHMKDGFRMYHGETVPGFPGHPHRGFETVTVVRKGMVDHSDSMGAAGRYGDGDVQWMTSGKGVQHAEMFPLIKQEEENPMELFQIWLNLPKADKMVEPHFKMLWNENIPKIDYKDVNGKTSNIEVIAGTLHNQSAPTPPPDSWAAKSGNEVAILNIHMQAGGTYTLPKASEGVNRSIYFYSGDVLDLNGNTLKHYHSADVLASADITLTAGTKECKILILQGKPIAEPVVQHGPFVMNTIEEIRETYSEFQRTRFGGWPWPKYDHVHEASKGRFAKHADGRLEDMG
ncbi:MAG: redox-sensitive bicupin YhaK (pirin superfamily) [Bacteroidia bacterium]|jgi:redox-sensitive bicupin YhaK (pirin superfamily)